MKTTTLKILLLYFLMISSFASYTQSNTTDSLKVDSLKRVLQTQKEDTNKVNTLNALAMKVEDLKFVMRYATDAFSLAQKINFKKGEGIASFYIGYAHFNLNDYTDALKFFNISLKTMQEIDNKAGIGDAYRFIGNSYAMQNERPEALKNYLLGLDAAKKSDNKSILILLYMAMHTHYWYEGNYGEAIRYGYLALNLAEEEGDKNWIAYSFFNLANAYSLQGNYREALKTSLAGLQVFKEINDINGIAGSHGTIGEQYFQMKNYPRALEEYLYALKLYEQWQKSGHRVPIEAISYIRNSIGLVYEKQGEIALSEGNKDLSLQNFAEAKKNYLAATKSLHPYGKFNSANAYLHLGNINIKLNNLAEAEDYLDKGMQLAKETGNKEAMKNGYAYKTVLDSMYKNYRQAYEDYKTYILYRDSLINEESTKKSLQSQIQYESDKKQAVAKAKQEKKDALAAAELKNQKLMRNFSLSGVVAVIFFAGYSFYYYRRKKTLQNQQSLMKERLRISRELHDEVGATLSGIAMYSHLTKEQIKQANTTEVEKSLNIMQQSAGEMVNKLNDIVWLVNPDQDSLQKLIQRLEEYARDMAVIKNMQVKVNVPEHLHEHSLPMESRRNIYLFCKEAINNAVKYSNGTLLELNIKETDSKLEFSVSDNGKGFDAVMVRRGNGLENMQKRADEIGAKLTIQSKQNEGALVSMQVKIT